MLKTRFICSLVGMLFLIGGLSVSCQRADNTLPAVPEYTGEIQSGKAVDLGLSVQWAGCNLGADAPQDPGHYYAWGETGSRTSTGYAKDNYTLWNGLQYEPYGPDGVIRLRAGEDAAAVTWGDGWRLPSPEEVQELIEKCTWTYSVYKGVKGYVVTASAEAGGQSIFLPMPGYQAGSEQNHREQRGVYWAGRLGGANSDYGATLFLNEETYGSGLMHRYYGAAVRPDCVAGGETPSSVSRTMPDAAGLLQASPVIGDVAWSETRTVTDGVQLTQMVATLSSGFPETLHLLTVDLEADGIHMRVALPDNAKETPAGEWPRQTLSAMASGLTSETDQVVAMVNSSFWNTTTFTPRGPVHSDGSVLWTTFEPTSKQGLSYVGYTTNGVVRIADSEDYTITPPAVFTDVTGSGLILVSRGAEVKEFSDESREPRTAIGYTADNYLFLLVADGRNPGIAEGLTHNDMAGIFASLGCMGAVNVDGGGSAQMLVRDAETGAYGICNKPSDGAERPVIDGWAVMKRM